MPDLLSLLPAALCLFLAGWLLRLQRCPAAGPGGSCRRYSVPGRGFHLKKWALSGILFFAFRRRRRERGGGAARREPMGSGAGQGALERLQGLVCHAHALDSVYFTGFTETDKTFVITRLGRRPNGLCEMWLFLRVDGIGEFEHPVHPDMMVRDESEKCWRAEGLMIECLEPHRHWKITFNGRLRKGPYRHQWNEEEGELVHVKFSFHWTSFSDIFDFNLDSHPKVFAHAIALEKWSAEFFRRVKKDGEQHSRYEQWGQSIGEIEIEGHEKKEVSMRGVRSHSYGIRNWAEIYRYVMILMHCELVTLSAFLTTDPSIQLALTSLHRLPLKSLTVSLASCLLFVRESKEIFNFLAPFPSMHYHPSAVPRVPLGTTHPQFCAESELGWYCPVASIKEPAVCSMKEVVHFN
ncbi:uncharacterized protein [Lepidochelys kempii]|uniref:uncharacterized protein isoform X3 n=1 Tax=Lepidochelys kempii TaxID=8472 RepID=UPI003C6F238D